MRSGDLPAWLACQRPIGYGRRVPARPVEQVTTAELLAVSGSSRDTLYEWAAKRLLPRPNVATGPGGEQFAVWPVESLERVRFIAGQLRQGMAIEAIVALVEERRPRR
jgi:predicted DNA-binding transcriptional regulator AlpA